jgi:hypothetical protein
MIGRKWVKIGVIAAVADMGGITVLSAGTSGGGVGRRGMDPGFFSLYNKRGIIVIFCRKKDGGAGAILRHKPAVRRVDPKKTQPKKIVDIFGPER